MIKSLAFAAIALVTAPSLVGPPWLSVEYPPNPMDPELRGAVLAVHTYHHGNTVWIPVTCSAEGLVKGQRRSIPCELTRTSRPAVYVLKERVTPTEGVWTLVFNAGGRGEGATALVDVDQQGQVLAVKVPTQGEGNRTWPAGVTDGDINLALHKRAEAVRVAGR